jgi:hypothetical protein
MAVKHAYCHAQDICCPLSMPITLTVSDEQKDLATAVKRACRNFVNIVEDVVSAMSAHVVLEIACIISHIVN